MIDRVVVARAALREATLVVLSVAGAVLFLNHQVLYFDGSPPSSAGWTAYAVSTLAIYLFVRTVVLVAGGPPSRPLTQGRCPQCGYPLGEATLRGVPHTSAHSRAGALIPLSMPERRPANPALALGLVNPSAPIADEVVDALLMRVVMGTPQESATARSAQSERRPQSPGDAF
ncbi:MAG TPA: hypothetical protein VJ400_07985 [Thermoplasmata archaeon]|nr:hypothetical protein [Thermoplasmata archaeon]